MTPVCEVWTPEIIAARIAARAAAGPVPLRAVSPIDVPVYHSNPGAALTLYLNFGGETGIPTAAIDDCDPFDLDGSTSGFSSLELLAIRQAWKQAAEAYRPWDIDVTTERPAAMGPNGAVVAGDGAWAACLIGYYFADPNVVGSSSADLQSAVVGGNICLVRSSPTYGHGLSGQIDTTAEASLEGARIGSAAAHELGHVLGLGHQSKWINGALYAPYDPGIDDDLQYLPVAPTMGGAPFRVGVGNARGVWRIGATQTNSSNTAQDDLAIIDTQVARRTQTYASTAAALDVFDGDEVDGVLTTFDAEVFHRITVVEDNGRIVTARVASPDPGVGILLPRIELRDAAGTVLAADGKEPEYVAGAEGLAYEFSAEVAVSVLPGVYYIVVAGYGTPGDIGSFTLSVSTGPILRCLEHSPADVLRYLMVSKGVCAFPPVAVWPAFCSAEPQLPDNCVTFYDTAGVQHGRSMIDGELFQNYGVQVRVRSRDHAGGWVKADQLQTAMAKSVLRETVTIDDKEYFVHAVVAIGNVLPLGKDAASKRSLFTINVMVVMHQVIEEASSSDTDEGSLTFIDEVNTGLLAVL